MSRALRGSNFGTKIGLGRLTELAIIALRNVAGDHVISYGDGGDTLAHGFDDASALVTQNHGKKT